MLETMRFSESESKVNLGQVLEYRVFRSNLLIWLKPFASQMRSVPEHLGEIQAPVSAECENRHRDLGIGLKNELASKATLSIHKERKTN